MSLMATGYYILSSGVWRFVSGLLLSVMLLHCRRRRSDGAKRGRRGVPSPPFDPRLIIPKILIYSDRTDAAGSRFIGSNPDLDFWSMIWSWFMTVRPNIWTAPEPKRESYDRVGRTKPPDTIYRRVMRFLRVYMLLCDETMWPAY